MAISMIDIIGAKAFEAEEEARKARIDAMEAEAQGTEESRAARDIDNDEDDSTENAPKEGEGALDPAHDDVSSGLSACSLKHVEVYASRKVALLSSYCTSVSNVNIVVCRCLLPSHTYALGGKL